MAKKKAAVDMTATFKNGMNKERTKQATLQGLMLLVYMCGMGVFSYIVSMIPAGLFGVMIAIVMQGMLRDGVTTWMPSYISETYNLSNAIAILTGVVLPVFSNGSLLTDYWKPARTFDEQRELEMHHISSLLICIVFLLFQSGKSKNKQ